MFKQSPYSLSMHHFIRAGILAGFTMYLMHLVKTDTLYYYVAPRMEIYVKLSAIGFYVIAVYQVFLGAKALLGQYDPCHCHHPPSSSFIINVFIYSLFVFPLVLAFMMPDQLLGSTLAAKKGMQYQASVSLGQDDSLASKSIPSPSEQISRDTNLEPSTIPSDEQKEPISVADQDDQNNIELSTSTGENQIAETDLDQMFDENDPFTKMFAAYGKELYQLDQIEVETEFFMEILTTIDLFLEHFVGKQIQIRGFVYREEMMKEDQFVIARFSMNCCAADAAPYGVLVHYDQANNYGEDEWLEVTGTLTQTNYQGNDIMMIEAETVSSIPTPDDPYVYPNYNFGSQ